MYYRCLTFLLWINNKVLSTVKINMKTHKHTFPVKILSTWTSTSSLKCWIYFISLHKDQTLHFVLFSVNYLSENKYTVCKEHKSESWISHNKSLCTQVCLSSSKLTWMFAAGYVSLLESCFLCNSAFFPMGTLYYNLSRKTVLDGKLVSGRKTCLIWIRWRTSFPT